MPERKQYDPQERLDQTMERLKEGVKEIFESGRYQEYLSVMSRFHRYSISNTILIALQRPDATHVAGYNAWRDKFGRQVRRGERGIDIIAPVTRRVRREEDERETDETAKSDEQVENEPKAETRGRRRAEGMKVVTSFKVAKVFDVSQTEGRDLPTLGVDELVGDVERYGDVMKAIEQAAPCPIRDCAAGIIDDVDRSLEAIEQERMESIDQAAFFVPERGYLEIHRNSENQWDYTLYVTDFQEIDGGVIESDAPLPQAVDDACALQDLDFDALQPVDAGNLADKVDQCRTSAYARSIAKGAPRDASIVEKSNLRLRRPYRHADEHHEGQRAHRNHDDKHHGDAQRKPRHAKNRDLER